MSTEPEQLIDLIAAQTRSLLQDHWPDIDSYRDGADDIKVSFSHKLSYDGSNRTVKTTISFSHTMKDQVEHSINTAQKDLPFQVTSEKREAKK